MIMSIEATIILFSFFVIWLLSLYVKIWVQTQVARIKETQLFIIGWLKGVASGVLLTILVIVFVFSVYHLS